MKTLNQKLVLAFIMIFSVFTISAQEAKVVMTESKLTVDGTSNIHDWTIDGKSLNGNLNAVIENNALKSIKSLEFNVVVEQLKSGRNGMDENTFKALNSKKYKNISYTLTKVVKISKTAENLYLVETQGELFVAGTTKIINQNFTVILSGKKIIISGRQVIDMTVYGVKPPTALLGTIKTGKNVTVNFKVTFN
jgi:hypothetical protein